MSSSTTAAAAANKARRIAPVSIVEIEDSPVVVEIYQQTDPFLVDGDVLVVVVKTKGSWQERFDTFIASLLHRRHGDHFHKQLKDASAKHPFTPGQTLMTSGAGMSVRPPFKNVLFVSGKNPLSAMLDAVFETANDYGCTEVVFPLEAIAETESQALNSKFLNDLLSEILLAIETATLTKVRCIKVVLPGGIGE